MSKDMVEGHEHKFSSFGRQLQLLLESRGVSANSLSKAVDIDPGRLSKILIHDAKPPRRPDFYIKLRNFLGLSLMEWAALNISGGAPREILPDEHEYLDQCYVGVVEAEGIKVELYADPLMIDLDEAEKELIVSEMKLTIGDYVRRKSERLQRLEE